MLRRHLLGGAAGTLLAAPALAQGGFPNRNIRMIVPYPPGGATDAMSRLAAQKIQEKLGVTVVVENRSGANGQVGSQAVLQAGADGYTILGSASIHVMARSVMRNVPYDPVADFVPLARTARGPLVLVMSPQRPQRTIPDVVAAAKAEPARWSFATSSLGSAGHLGTIEFNRVTGSNIEIVGYRGTAPALTDVAAGNAHLMFDPVLATLPMVRGGQFGPGYRDRRAHAARPRPADHGGGRPAGLRILLLVRHMGTARRAAEIVARYNAALVDGMREPAVVERLTGLGFEPVAESVAEVERFIADDVRRNVELLRIANFQPE